MANRKRINSRQTILRALSFLAIVVCFNFVFVNCGTNNSSSPAPANSNNGSGDTSPTRSFKMGFSFWPWDATQAAVDWTRAKAQEHGDVVSMHIEEGVPWNEALNGTQFPSSYMSSLSGYNSSILPGKARLLQVNALDIGRKNLAPFRGASPNQPLTEPWTSYSFDNPNVKLAYANYVERMIQITSPTWVLLGVESNLLIRNAPEKWDAYVDLICSTTSSLRSRGVTQPLYVSMFSVPFFPEWSGEDVLADQLKGLADLKDCVDGFAISVHPFMSGLLAESFPSDYFSRLLAYSEKWVGISESSYPAQEWELNGIIWRGTPAKQNDFLQKMLLSAETGKLKFVVWYAIRDFDQLWEGALARDPVALIWRDTGLYDESGAGRLGLTTWQRELAKPLSP